jgi:hypothetical protein
MIPEDPHNASLEFRFVPGTLHPAHLNVLNPLGIPVHRGHEGCVLQYTTVELLREVEWDRHAIDNQRHVAATAIWTFALVAVTRIAVE